MGGDIEVLSRIGAAKCDMAFLCPETPLNIYADYFTKVLEDDLKAVVKPQYVDQIPKAVKGPEKSVEALLKARAQMDNLEKILDVLGKECLRQLAAGANNILELRQVLDRDINLLSGGELQRFAIGIVCVQQADV